MRRKGGEPDRDGIVWVTDVYRDPKEWAEAVLALAPPERWTDQNPLFPPRAPNPSPKGRRIVITGYAAYEHDPDAPDPQAELEAAIDHERLHAGLGASQPTTAASSSPATGSPRARNP